MRQVRSTWRWVSMSVLCKWAWRCVGFWWMICGQLEGANHPTLANVPSPIRPHEGVGWLAVNVNFWTCGCFCNILILEIIPELQQKSLKKELFGDFDLGNRNPCLLRTIDFAPIWSWRAVDDTFDGRVGSKKEMPDKMRAMANHGDQRCITCQWYWSVPLSISTFCKDFIRL